ncbi:stalk domain-containing protein [Zhenhengia yiwuensis]|uniref:stalk domain-containing protein n=1 Tax=Zhenhengia yiwuensis TaxID=2763666 RepID=UPI002A750641|nr:stalk domain-containing protein [Zhenhengia yiwuensis]MDY3367241.1 stalk domain-containing protein [Zhenhengia yiwuensis]
MKLRSKKIMAVLMASTIATGAFAVSAANLTKNVQLRYNNINVKVDGQYKVPNMEPFFIGDSVYVSLRDAGQLIGSQVNWNGTTNTVEINTSSIANSALETELAARNHELAVAKSEMQKMQAKIEQYEKKLGITDDKEDDKDTDKEDNKDEDNSITSSDLKDMLKKLDKYYSDKYDVEWEFTLKGNEKGLRLTMEYDSKQDGKAFKAISKSSLEKLAKDIMRDIQSDLGKIKVEGKVYDTREEVTKAEFTMSTKGVFDFEYKRNNNITDEDLKEFTKILEDKYGKFPALNLGATFDGSSIRVRSVKLIQDGDEIEFEIYTDYANMSVAKKAWDDMSGASKDKLETYLDDIQEEIEEEFDVDATGYVFNESKEIIARYDTSLKLN